MQYVVADLAQPSLLLLALQRQGWDAARPTVVVVEGLSYYLSRAVLWNALRLFRTDDRRNAVILTYIKRAKSIDQPQRRIIARVFGAVADAVGSRRRITRYDRREIEQIVAAMGGQVKDHWSLHRAELTRIGRRCHFPTDRSGSSENTVFVW